jgi:proline dehydrogenase
MKRYFRELVQMAAARAAKNYIVGSNLADGVRAARLMPKGIGSTICFWDGEGEDPRLVANRYLAVIDAISDERLDCYASIKPWSLRFSSDLLAEIFERARGKNVAVHFDALTPPLAEQMLALVEMPLPKGIRLGCTLPGRWRRSIADADRAVQNNLSVRVVKGQFVDAQNGEIDPWGGFLQVVDRLAGKARHVAVATHDAALARQALDRLRVAGTSSELELLFGLPMQPSMSVARALGVPVRIYLPVGNAWLPYVIAQARSNPRIAWWILRDLLSATCLSAPGSP